MKVRAAFTFTPDQLGRIRAAHGRGGKATRKECVTFIDRAVHAALSAAPEPKRRRVVDKTVTISNREYAATANKTAADAAPADEPADVTSTRVRTRIAKLYGKPLPTT